MCAQPTRAWPKQQVMLGFTIQVFSCSQKYPLTGTSSFPHSHPHSYIFAQPIHSAYAQLTHSVWSKGWWEPWGHSEATRDLPAQTWVTPPPLWTQVSVLFIDASSWSPFSFLHVHVLSCFRISIVAPLSQALLSSHPAFKSFYSINQPSTVRSIKIFSVSNWPVSQNFSLREPSYSSVYYQVIWPTSKPAFIYLEHGADA